MLFVGLMIVACAFLAPFGTYQLGVGNKLLGWLAFAAYLFIIEVNVTFLQIHEHDFYAGVGVGIFGAVFWVLVAGAPALVERLERCSQRD